MSHILAKLKGVKLEDIKKALEADAGKHAQHGLRLEHVWENDDNPQEVQFLFESNDLAEARKFISEVHTNAQEKDPAINLPSMTFLAGEDEEELELPELPEDEDKKGDEKDTKKKAEQSAPDASKLPLKSIALAISSALVGAALSAGSISLSCPVPQILPPTQVTETAEVPVKVVPFLHPPIAPASTVTNSGIKTTPRAETPAKATTTSSVAPASALRTDTASTAGLDGMMPATR